MFDDTDNFIKDNLQNILDGNFDDKFEPEQLKMMLELSFLYNHTIFSHQDDLAIFEYNSVKLKLNWRTQDVFIPVRCTNIGIKPEEEIVSLIRSSDIFKSALKQFLRDKKISDILE